VRAEAGRLFVKICGITSAEDAWRATEAGADALGFVFWPKSPRFVTPEAAAAIAAKVPSFVTRVGVFVGAPLEELERTADVAGLDVLQVHGDETPAVLRALPRRVLKTLSVGPGFAAASALAYADAGIGLLLDTHRDGLPGGSGMVFDWTLARDLRDQVPFLVLAGGLRPENVAEAVAVVRPHAVDVSSGVESSPGRKDEGKLRAFIAAAQGAAAARAVSPGRATA
jgi:phosphoribosylanthranilate isomerase